MRLQRLSFGGERHSNTFHSKKMFPGVTGRSFTEAKAPEVQTGTCCEEGQGREREGAGQSVAEGRKRELPMAPWIPAQGWAQGQPGWQRAQTRAGTRRKAWREERSPSALD